MEEEKAYIFHFNHNSIRVTENVLYRKKSNQAKANIANTDMNKTASTGGFFLFSGGRRQAKRATPS